MSAYFKDLSDGIVTALKGMSVTGKHPFSKPVTVQYPNEQLPIADAFCGKHKLVQEGCRACGLCEKACPVDCIFTDSERHMKRVIEWKAFTIDYNKCIFCGLCVEACPSEALLMTKEFDLSTYDRRESIIDFLEWKGLRPEDLEKIEILKKEAEEKKKKDAEKKKKTAENNAGGLAADGDKE